ncbi:MAG: GyrI-like domain-containing protein [Spirochaetaceae bacterium]|nr:GyrI-like domain-containing protein [Spirochaetaceae bacterium]
MPTKIDLRSRYKGVYSAMKEPSLIKIPSLSAFAIDGTGDPTNSPRFRTCVEALYAASYTLKFALKKERGFDWGVLGLEGEWWCDNIEEFSMDRRGDWLWSLFIVQPEEVSEAETNSAIAAAKKKKGLPALDELRFERRPAHEAAHILHLGSYDAESPTIERLHAFIGASGLRLAGHHREIYLNDARRTDPAKLKTIIRQPVVR